MLTECATFMSHSVFYCVYMITLKRHDLFYITMVLTLIFETTNKKIIFANLIYYYW